MLPAVQEKNLQAKQAIFQELFGSPSNTRYPTILVRSETDTLLQDSVPSPEENYAFVAPSQSFLNPTALEYTAENTPSPNPAPSLEHANSLDYDSDDVSDFLPTPESPCLAQSRKDSARRTDIKSHHFKKTQTLKRSSSVRRKLDFRKPSRSAQSVRVPKSKKMGVVPSEYVPRRSWSYAEKEFLCVLYRWYTCSTVDLARLFNHFFDLDLPRATVNAQ
jgi:hypothetical protein